MNEDSFQNAFRVMERMASSGVFDDRFHRLVGSTRAVDDFWAQVKQKINKERPGVLGDEHGAPADLWTEIFKVELPINAQILELLIVLQRLSFRFETKALPKKG
jgi:hypothetical protein